MSFRSSCEREVICHQGSILLLILLHIRTLAHIITSKLVLPCKQQTAPALPSPKSQPAQQKCPTGAAVVRLPAAKHEGFFRWEICRAPTKPKILYLRSPVPLAADFTRTLKFFCGAWIVGVRERLVDFISVVGSAT